LCDILVDVPLLAGVDASAAQKQPVNKTCLQCGAILPSGISACRFCDSQFQPRGDTERASVLPRHGAELSAADAALCSNGGVFPSRRTIRRSALLSPIRLTRGGVNWRIAWRLIASGAAKCLPTQPRRSYPSRSR